MFLFRVLETNSSSLQVNFEDEARIKFLKLLGFSKDELERKVLRSIMYGVSLYPIHSVVYFVPYCISVLFPQISKCLGKNFQANGHGVDAKDLAEKMQQLSTEVSKAQLQTEKFISKHF